MFIYTSVEPVGIPDAEPAAAAASFCVLVINTQDFDEPTYSLSLLYY